MEIAFLIGRIIFGLYWLDNARAHFMNVESMAAYAAYKKVPMPKVAVMGTGVLLLVGGLSILLGLWPIIAQIALILFLIPTAFMMHTYWKETDPQAKMTQRIYFMRNLAYVGVLLMLSMIQTPWPYSLGM
jgi:uncharacterized membrane protein YphA (DoxX/SURF4 family)